MTDQLLFANQASTTLAGTLNTSATTVSVATGTGAEFPTPSGGQYFVLVLSKSGNSAIYEVCHCTGVSGDNLTIVRAQEGTVGQSWAVGDIAANLVTAGTMQYLPQPSDVQTQAGNYAVDTGTANAMVVTLSPVPASLAALAGVPIRTKKIASANTGAVTIAVNGFTATALKTNAAAAMVNGQLPASCDIEFTYNPTLACYVLMSATGEVSGADLIAGSVATAALAANAVTNAKAAQMATMTVKANDTGGTANPADVTFAQFLIDLGLAPFVSAGNAVSGTEVFAAHGLGVAPSRWSATLVNVSAEFGYSPGDEVICPAVTYTQGGGGTGAWGATWADATNVGWSWSDITRISIGQKGGGSPGPSPNANGYIVAAHWTVTLRAWLN